MGGFCTPSLDLGVSRYVWGSSELDVRASSVRDGVLRLVPASVGPRSKSSARLGAAHTRCVRLRNRRRTPALPSTTSPRWTTGAGRSCDRSHSRGSVARCERTVPPTRRSHRSMRRSRADYAGWLRLGDLLLHRFFAFACCVRRLRLRAGGGRSLGAGARPGSSGIGAGHARRPTDPLPLPSRSAHRRPRRRVVGGRPPLVMGTMGRRRGAAGRAADGTNVVGARDRVPPDPRRGHGPQRAPGHCRCRARSASPGRRRARST